MPESFSQKTRSKALKRLNDERNKLQHFGSTSSHEAINTFACQALEVLLQFIDKHLLPGASKDDAEQLRQAEGVIRRALMEIGVVRQARLERLAPELDALAGMVIACPECLHLAYPLEGEHRCLFCNQDWSENDDSEVAIEYAENVLGCSRYWGAAQGLDSWPVTTCPECDDEALVVGVTLRGADDQTANVCFSCFFTADDNYLFTCLGCGQLVVSKYKTSMCSNCLDYRVSKD